MANFKKLADRAKMARAIVDKQGGTEGLKSKVDRLRDVAMSEGTVGERAKAAAAVAREKPNPASPTPAGGGEAPPASGEPQAEPAAEPAKPANPAAAAEATGQGEAAEETQAEPTGPAAGEGSRA